MAAKRVFPNSLWKALSKRHNNQPRGGQDALPRFRSLFRVSLDRYPVSVPTKWDADAGHDPDEGRIPLSGLIIRQLALNVPTQHPTIMPPRGMEYPAPPPNAKPEVVSSSSGWLSDLYACERNPTSPKMKGPLHLPRRRTFQFHRSHPGVWSLIIVMPFTLIVCSTVQAVDKGIRAHSHPTGY